VLYSRHAHGIQPPAQPLGLRTFRSLRLRQPRRHYQNKGTCPAFQRQVYLRRILLQRFHQRQSSPARVLDDLCGYCRAEAPLVEKISHEYAEKDFIVLAINVGESRKTVKKYLDQNPRTCRIVLTEDTNLAAMYAATAYPIYVVIDREGNIAGTQRGAAGEDALRSLLARAGLGCDPDADSE
jgi:thiol-disulfide isomerase/thioredoxin